MTARVASLESFTAPAKDVFRVWSPSMDPKIPAGLEVVPPTEGTKHAQAHSGYHISEGLEVAPTTDSDKEVQQPEKEVLPSEESSAATEEKLRAHEEDGMPPANAQMSHTATNGHHRPRRICGVKLKLLLAWTAVAAVVVIGLAIGLGVGLSKNKDSGTTSSADAPPPTVTTPAEDTLSIGGSLDDSYYARKGAWNGTGLSITEQLYASGLALSPDRKPWYIMYYQHYSGAIRWMYRASPLNWRRGLEQYEMVTLDAKNATPIAAWKTEVNQTSIWEVFCKHPDLEHCCEPQSSHKYQTDAFAQTLTETIKFASATAAILPPGGPMAR